MFLFLNIDLKYKQITKYMHNEDLFLKKFKNMDMIRLALKLMFRFLFYEYMVASIYLIYERSVE